MKQQMQAYLDYLAKADYEKLMSLFSSDAKVISPLYGVQKASDFYQKLFEDTNESILVLQDSFINQEKKTASINFVYTWKMANGEETYFDCVDVFQFNDDYKIKQLKIIYDTAATRPLFNK